MHVFKYPNDNHWLTCLLDINYRVFKNQKMCVCVCVCVFSYHKMFSVLRLITYLGHLSNLLHIEISIANI